jgi:hypothetical protein
MIFGNLSGFDFTKAVLWPVYKFRQQHEYSCRYLAETFAHKMLTINELQVGRQHYRRADAAGLTALCLFKNATLSFTTG